MNEQPISPTPPQIQEPKKNIWLWIFLVIVLILAGVFFWWNFYGQKTPTAPTSTTTTTPTSQSPNQKTDDDLKAVSFDLDNLNSDFNQLDEIDATEDETPTF